MKKLIISLVLPLICLSANAIDSEDMYPFGWVTCTDVNDSGYYNLTGGTGGKKIILQSDGKDMRDKIVDAINNYSVIVLDGSKGDFLISSIMCFRDLKNKTIVGVRGAVLRTEFHFTPDIHRLMDEKNITQYSDMGDGGYLTNGRFVDEEREQHVRQFLIDYTGDMSESYRNAGIFGFYGDSSNLIVRNINFQGPGALDVEGADIIDVQGTSNHIWIDHCVFNDGMDGNIDLYGDGVDFITVSWCVFQYSDYSYIHMNTNLNVSKVGHFTFAYNVWGARCNGRMPASNCPYLHLLNNYYCCVGNTEESVRINGDCRLLMEGSYFDKGVKNIFLTFTDTTVWDFKDNICVEGYDFQSKGSVTVPYKYTKYPVETLPEMILGPHGAGCHL